VGSYWGQELETKESFKLRHRPTILFCFGPPPANDLLLACVRRALLNLIFHRGISRADGIDILEEGGLLRIDAEIFPKFLVLGSR